MWISRSSSELWQPSSKSPGSWKSLNGWTPSSWPSIKNLLPTMRTGSTHELLPWHGTCTSGVALGLAPWPRSMGGARGTASCPATSAEAPRAGPAGPPSPGGAENGGKGPRWGLQTDASGTERSGQNRWTGGSCQQEALEQMMLG